MTSSTKILDILWSELQEMARDAELGQRAQKIISELETKILALEAKIVTLEGKIKFQDSINSEYPQAAQIPVALMHKQLAATIKLAMAHIQPLDNILADAYNLFRPECGRSRDSGTRELFVCIKSACESLDQVVYNLEDALSSPYDITRPT